MSNFDENLTVDEKKVNRLIRRILLVERQNIESEKKNVADMVKEIRQMIEEEVKCY